MSVRDVHLGRVMDLFIFNEEAEVHMTTGMHTHGATSYNCNSCNFHHSLLKKCDTISIIT